MNKYIPKHCRLQHRPIALAVLLAWGSVGAAGTPPPAAYDLVLAPTMQADNGNAANRGVRHGPLQRAKSVVALPVPQGNTIAVQNCNDHGNGSLRDAIAGAQSNDTIDLGQLSCSNITLTTGQITIPQDNLTLAGPGADQLTIDGGASANNHNRIFDHPGTGTLHVNRLTLTDAKYETSVRGASGGCIHSKGKVSLSESTMTQCTASEQGIFVAAGGAIFAHGVVLQHSIVTGNFSTATSEGGNTSGGIFCYGGDLIVKYSTVSNNTAAGINSSAGGIEVDSGDTYIMGSTLSGNTSRLYGAMHVSHTDGLPHTAQIFNTTISGNHATNTDAGIGLDETDVTLTNSTIAFNHADVHAEGAGFRTVGAQPIHIESSIIANNIAAGIDSDANMDAAATVTGDNNLITQHAGPVPSGYSTACPRIGPLGDHGGETQTHPLLPGSPALDAGDNSERGFDFDQRGTGYPRTHGSQPDIGAFEDHGVPTDGLFNSGFDGRCR